VTKFVATLKRLSYPVTGILPVNDLQEAGPAGRSPERFYVIPAGYGRRVEKVACRDQNRASFLQIE